MKPDICTPDNDQSFWWLIMPPESGVRNCVVELTYELEDYWFRATRRHYHCKTVWRFIKEGGKLIRIKEPKA